MKTVKRYFEKFEHVPVEIGCYDVYVHYLSKPNIHESRPPLFDGSFTTSSNYSGTSLKRSPMRQKNLVVSTGWPY